MSLTPHALEWAAFQDNLLCCDRDDYMITPAQVQKVVITLQQALINNKMRHGVMNLLFNPVALKRIGKIVYSTNDMTMHMASSLLNYILDPENNHRVSQIGREFLHFMEAIAEKRNKLKGQLASDRIEITEAGVFPLCAYCGAALIHRNYDMHELIITRGDVQKCEPELVSAIMVLENCVLVEHGVCHISAHSKEGRKKIIREHLTKHVSYESVLLWLSSLQFKSSIGEDAIRLIKEIQYEQEK